MDSHILRSGITSTHDLHTEVDRIPPDLSVADTTLQLTTSTRRSTHFREFVEHVFDTSTHDLHTEVDKSSLPMIDLYSDTSTHDLHTEVDSIPYFLITWYTYFNSRPPHGGRPGSPDAIRKRYHFNSRPPHGGRPMSGGGSGSDKSLQLTTSTRRSTMSMVCVISFKQLQLTTSTRRSTIFPVHMSHPARLQLTTSTRRSTFTVVEIPADFVTSTHDLHTEVDLCIRKSNMKAPSLQLTTSTRRSTAIFHKIAKNILSHLQHFSYQIPYLTHFPLPFSASLPLFHLYFWCESLGIFCSLHIRTKKLMSHSHQN